MAADGSFLVEDFLAAITSQLDRTQDALALKAVNRPLTYAIKDFALELKVFVDVDPEGRVRFRSPGPGEQGASSVNIGFTTITRPMIQENTVEMSAARAPTLAESGLSEGERQRLERIGVRTTAELQRLRHTAGTEGLSRIADIPVNRLRRALTLGRPQVRDVRPVASPNTPPAALVRPVRPNAPVSPSPIARPPTSRPPSRPMPPSATPPKVATVPPAARRIELLGRNLLGSHGPPTVRLGGIPLAVAEADDGRLLVELPPEALTASGTLEIDHEDGERPLTYELAPADPWAPVET